MHLVGSFADFGPVAALFPDDHIAMRVHIWQKDHPDEEILIGVPIVGRGEESFLDPIADARETASVVELPFKRAAVTTLDKA
jgi:hypothetical protein